MSVQVIYNLRYKTYLESTLISLGIVVRSFLNTKRINEIKYPKRIRLLKQDIIMS